MAKILASAKARALESYYCWLEMFSESGFATLGEMVVARPHSTIPGGIHRYSKIIEWIDARTNS